MQREEPRNRMSNDTWKMGASPQTPGVLRIGPMGLNAAVRAAPGKDPTSAARRREAPLAKSAAPVALQQSRILRITPETRTLTTLWQHPSHQYHSCASSVCT